MIKAKDPCLQLINVAVSSFLNPNLALEGVQQVEPLPPYMAEDEATPSQPNIKEEEEEEMVEVPNSEDDFEIFNQLQSPGASTSDFGDLPPAQASHTQKALFIPNAMVLQHKTRTSLLDLLEAMCLRRQSKPNSPFFLLLKFPSLTLLTKRENKIKRERWWWRMGETFRPRKPSPRKGANMLGSCKQNSLVRVLSQTGGVTTKLKSQPGPPPQCWTELLFPMMPPSGTSNRAGLDMWPMPWSRLCCCLLIWLTLG